MAVADDPQRVTDHSPSDSMSSSTPSSPSSSSAVPLPSSSPHVNGHGNGNGTPDFQIPRYNFPPNLLPQHTQFRRQPSIKSPIPRYHHDAAPAISPSILSSSSSSTPTPRHPSQESNHVTETHHITKDYDSRTGAKTINRYEFQETVGRGVHGKVKLARDIETGELVAIKIVNRVTKKRLGRWDPMEAEQKIRREIAIMKKCKHPNVVALREVMDDPNSKKIYLGIFILYFWLMKYSNIWEEDSYSGEMQMIILY